jgi:hypothetical protein
LHRLYDPVNRIGDFRNRWARDRRSPVEASPRAVVMEGLRRLQAIGAQTALIGTASVNAPALRCYAACGFRKLVERQHYYSKVLT